MAQAAAVRDQVEAEVRSFLREQGLDKDLPQVHLDSVRLTELVARVERAAGAEVDFLEVDPEALDTLDGLVAQLTAALPAL
jgi:aryl carrier-like protein